MNKIEGSEGQHYQHNKGAHVLAKIQSLFYLFNIVSIISPILLESSALLRERPDFTSTST